MFQSLFSWTLLQLEEIDGKDDDAVIVSILVFLDSFATGKKQEIENFSRLAVFQSLFS